MEILCQVASNIENTVNEAVTYFEKQALEYEITIAADGTRELIN